MPRDHRGGAVPRRQTWVGTLPIHAPVDAPVELELVLAAARLHPNEEERERIGALIDRPIDWALFLELANQHKVLPIAHHNITQLWPSDGEIPRRLGIKSWLDEIRDRTDTAFEEMIALTDAFHDRGVATLWFKGPVLAEVAYGDRGLRELWDIDFLYRRADRSAIDAGLRQRGHDCITIIEEHQRRAYERYHFAYLYLRECPRSEVDAHFSLMPPAWSPIDQSTLWDRAVTLDIDGGQIRTFSPEDMAIYLALHAGKEQWSRLRMVCDMAFWLEAHPAIDWDGMIKRAHDWGAGRALRLGLLLAADWLAARIPEEIVRVARADRTVIALEAQLRARYWSATKDRKTAAALVTRYHLALLDRKRDRARYVLSNIFTPRLRHLSLVRMPASLGGLYIVVKVLHDYIALPVWLGLVKPVSRRLSGTRTEEPSA